jgi:hypothetical protein
MMLANQNAKLTGPDQGFLVSRLVLTLKPWERGCISIIVRNNKRRDITMQVPPTSTPSYVVFVMFVIIFLLVWIKFVSEVNKGHLHCYISSLIISYNYAYTAGCKQPLYILQF